MISAFLNYDIGVGDTDDLIDALGVFLRVSGEYYKAIFSFNTSVAALGRITGEGI